MDCPRMMGREIAIQLEMLRAHMLRLPGATEDFPFAPEIPVFKVSGKMFAYLSPHRVPPIVTLKLDPIHGQMLRATYGSVHPGYHMNKDHWNSIDLDGSLADEELLSWVDESYELVVRNLTRAQKKALQDLIGTKDTE